MKRVDNPAPALNSPLRRSWKIFRQDIPARIGVAGMIVLALPALLAPLLANGRPLLIIYKGKISLPFVRSFFAPDSSEVLVEQVFNYALLWSIMFLIWRLIPGQKIWKKAALILFSAALLIPFISVQGRMDKTDYRAKAAAETEAVTIFAPIKYGPFEIAGEPFEAPGSKHIFGCDDIGRDVGARLIYGARVSLTVGIFATLISLIIGTVMGLLTGYFRGWFDLLTMRVVEVLLCFPTFLLLLIIMSFMGDRKFSQAIPVVIGVIGFTGWIGLTFLVRGEVLKQSSMPYIKSCIVSGVPVRRILFRHLLPNIMPVILISFTFGVAGAILSESGLSFLGFGVQPPTASWGNLLRQAFDDPMAHWHLTLFPGMALFIAVMSFNFVGEGLRRALAPENAE